MADDITKLIEERLRRERAYAWSQGFLAGQSYGTSFERYDPNRDPGWDEPTKPENPWEDHP
jgi:hypothetical protein